MKQQKTKIMQNEKLKECYAELKILERKKRKGLTWLLFIPVFGWLIHMYVYNKRSNQPELQKPIDDIKMQIIQLEYKSMYEKFHGKKPENI